MLVRLKNHITLWQSFHTPWNYWLVIHGYKKQAKLALRTRPDAAPIHLTHTYCKAKINTLNLYSLASFSRKQQSFKIKYFKDKNQVVIRKNDWEQRFPWDWRLFYGLLLAVNKRLKLSKAGKMIRVRVNEEVVFNLRSGIFFGGDLQIVAEIWRDKMYSKYVRKLPQKSLIVDIGGYLGETAVFFAKTCNAQVHVYEPHPELYDILNQNIALNQSVKKQIKSYQEGVGKSASKIQMRDEAHAGFGMELCHNDHPPAVQIQTVDLQTIFNRCKRKIDLVKMDCEGAEYAALLHTEAEVLKQAKCYLVEYHGGNPQKLAHHLKKAGFDVTIENPFTTIEDTDIGILHALQRYA